MRTITVTEKYRAVQEGSLAKSEFVRQMRQSYPMYVSPVSDYNSTVQILKNRSLLFEAKEEVDDSFKYSDDSLRRAIDIELEAAGLMSHQSVSGEDQAKAKKKAIENLKKDPLHYYHLIAGESSKVDKHDKEAETKRGAGDVDTFNGLKKATLKEGHPKHADGTPKSNAEMTDDEKNNFYDDLDSVDTVTEDDDFISKIRSAVQGPEVDAIFAAAQKEIDNGDAEGMADALAIAADQYYEYYDSKGNEDGTEVAKYIMRSLPQSKSNVQDFSKLKDIVYKNRTVDEKMSDAEMDAIKNYTPGSDTSDIPTEYKPGDMYNTDFDYEGMLKAGLKIRLNTPAETMQAIFDSFEDVNYHREGEHLSYVIDAKEEGAREEALTHLKEFRKAIKQTLGEIFEGVFPIREREEGYVSRADRKIQEAIPTMKLKLEAPSTSIKTTMKEGVVNLYNKYGKDPGFGQMLKDFFKMHGSDLDAGADIEDEFEEYYNANTNSLEEAEPLDTTAAYDNDEDTQDMIDKMRRDGKDSEDFVDEASKDHDEEILAYIADTYIQNAKDGDRAYAAFRDLNIRDAVQDVIGILQDTKHPLHVDTKVEYRVVEKDKARGLFEKKGKDRGDIDSFRNVIQDVGVETVQDAIEVIIKFEKEIEKGPVGVAQAKRLVADLRATEKDEHDKNTTDLIIDAFNMVYHDRGVATIYTEKKGKDHDGDIDEQAKETTFDPKKIKSVSFPNGLEVTIGEPHPEEEGVVNFIRKGQNGYEIGFLDGDAGGSYAVDFNGEFLDQDDYIDEKKGTDHDKDGDIDGDDYKHAKDKAIKKAMGKNEIVKENLKAIISKVLEEQVIAEAATAQLSKLGDDYEGFDGMKASINGLENIVTDIEQYFDKTRQKIQKIYDTLGEIRNEEGLKVGGFLAPAIEQAFIKDLKPAISQGFTKGLNQPKVKTVSKANYPMSDIEEGPEEPKQTVFTPVYESKKKKQ